MKTLMVIFGISAIARAEINCTNAEALNIARPGAEWVMTNDSPRTLEWHDKIQSKPSLTEISAARTTCIEAKDGLVRDIAAAKLVINDKTKTESERLDAAIRLLTIQMEGK